MRVVRCCFPATTSPTRVRGGRVISLKTPGITTETRKEVPMFGRTSKTNTPAENELPIPDVRTFKSAVLDETRNKAITAREAEHYLATLRAEADACRMWVRTSIAKRSLEGGQRLRHAV